MNARPPAPSISRRTLLWAALAAFAAPVLFALYTNQSWEDYWITFRSSRNLAEGHGLVYQAGEKVHTFTSPLGVLVPALGFTLTHTDAGALWFLRIASALALAGAAVLVVQHARSEGWPGPVAWLALGLGLLEAKVVAFSANGMETALLVFFTALAWRELTRPDAPRWRRLAAAYAGLMWTRPDACILAAAMTFAAWAFVARPGPGDGRAWWRALLAALGMGGLLYAPWFFWAWHYYGSPVPQTIIAKSVYTPDFSVLRILRAPLSCLVGNTALDDFFAPAYAHNGWPAGLLLFGRILARLAAFLWLVPGVSRATRAASFTALAGGVYFHQIMPYPWYFAPWTLCAALALAGGARAAALKLQAPWQGAARIAAAVTVSVVLLTSLAQAYGARRQQQLIEENGRKQIGLWLRAHAAPGDSVFLEPIGYIGYYSQLKILDFPGLCAPEVSRIVRSGPGGYARIIAALKPGWLVLRPYEIAQQNLQDSGKLADYAPVGFWSQRDKLDALDFVPGRFWLEFDAEFVVYRRKTPAP